MARHLLLPSTVLLFALLSSLTTADDKDSLCVYTVYVQTGTSAKAGTDSKVGLTLGDATGRTMSVPDLTSWGGLMGPNHRYFRRGGLDVFSARGPCGVGLLCHLNLTSTGTGTSRGWHCESVKVTATGPHVPCTSVKFSAHRWLATDAWPYQLYAAVDACGEGQARAPVVVGGGSVRTG